MSIDDALKKFDKHSKKLNAILDEASSEIRRVEAFLQESGCNYPFKWNIPESAAFFLWERGVDKKTFRLMFRPGKFRGARPFIEQKGDIRMKYVSYLEGFLEAFYLFIRLP